MNWKSQGLTELVQALEDGDVATRAAAARYLRSCGADAAEPLCRALEAEEMTVRTAAAESLGEIGDARAVEPLCAALKRCMGGWSARAYFRSGIFLVGAAVACLLFCLSVPAPDDTFIGFVLNGLGMMCASVIVVGFVSTSFRRWTYRKQGELTCAITEALAGIAERNPSPELRDLVPELRAIAADRLQQERSTRRVSKEAARRIDRATADLNNLPLPAAAPAPDPAVLARPAGAPDPDTRTLPRVR